MSSNLSASLKTVAKLILKARPCRIGGRARAGQLSNSKRLYILGNGPSLRFNLDNDLELLSQSDTLAVNFAANAPEFFNLRPRFYVLADPHFFRNDKDINVARLIDALRRVDWPLTLFVPVQAQTNVAHMFANTRVKVSGFNCLAAEGWKWLENIAFNRQLGMPRPRNVLIPSIMISIWLGYKEIILLGADHSWLKTLDVDADNRVVSIQPHFYKEDEREVERINRTYLDLHLYQVLESMTIAFASYHKIRRYASGRGVRIINATPGSMIDAFPRGALK